MGCRCEEEARIKNKRGRPKKSVVVKKKPIIEAKKKVFYITYIGAQTHLRVWGVPGMSKIRPGEKYKVSEKVYNSFRSDKDWKNEIILEKK